MQELTQRVQEKYEGYSEREIWEFMQSVDKVFDYFSPGTIRSIINEVIRKVIVSKTHITIRFSAFGISSLSDDEKKSSNGYCREYMEIKYPIDLHRKKGRVLLISPDECKTSYCIDTKILNALALAFKWADEIKSKKISITDFARRKGKDRSYMCRVLIMSNLAPDIVMAILNGKQPRQLKLENFTRDEIPYSWDKQRQKFGF